MKGIAPLFLSLSLGLVASGGEPPANTWVEISRERKAALPYCSAWHLPATDEFFIWGAHGGHRREGKVYEVRTLTLRDKAPSWRESFPKGKEKAWSGGKFPNWGCGCHQLRHKPDRPWRKDVRDRWTGSSGAINRVAFVETDGVTRPTRCQTHYQGAYDTKRNRLVYFAGGKTFAYDPEKRQWTDMKAKPPLACDALVYASMVYDPEGDRMILFGGAYALNPWGGARTWLFDCAQNQWKKAKVKDGREPPLRCSTQMVYDSKNKLVVLFGGDALDRFLADTWVLDPKTLTWTEKKPKRSPPLYDRWSGCFVEKHGLVLLATPTRGRKGRGRQGECWTYDAAGNIWTPLKGKMPWTSSEWLSCSYSPKDDVVLLQAPGVGTWLYRFDPATATDPDPKRAASKPGEWVWNSRSRRQNQSIMGAPKGDRKATEAALKKLPANQVVDNKYPGVLISKTWSTAIIDTDRGVVVYIGGGHSGYKGTDIALYDVGTNRWSFDAPACFVPFVYNYNSVLYGWDYRMRPQSQHTYRWYAYDPKSKLVIYCARPAGPHNGFTVQLRKDEPAFVYDRKKHGCWTFLYDPAGNQRYPPVFGRPFGNSWSLALCGTPQGVFAKSGGNLYLAKATVKEKKAGLKWELVDQGAPSGSGEFQPLVYDSKRKRLLLVAQKKGKNVQVWEHPPGKGAWKELTLQKSTPHMSREIVYDRANDCLVSIPENRLMILNLKTKEWKELDVAMPKGRYRTECAMVYDPVHKLCVMLIPRSFTGPMGLYLFRYDPKTAKFKE